MASEKHSSLSMLRLTAKHLKGVKFPQLVRPRIGPSAPATLELVHWGIQAYCLPWVRHFAALISGIVSLNESENKAAVRIVGRSSFELCAHAYYVKKHLKQQLDSKNISGAWNFLLPVATGSRYINEHHPEDSAMFPSPPHIKKAINCFKEVMPKGAEDDYSYLSEYCHPNTMAFQQHYRWTTPYTIDFVDQVDPGVFGSIASSSILGLMAIEELLGIGDEKGVRSAIIELLVAIADQAKGEKRR